MFECKIKSNPKPEVVWEHDGKAIRAVGRLKVSGRGLRPASEGVSTSRQATLQPEAGNIYHSSMEITDVTLQDAGKYKVIAKNEAGECSASISLNFDSKWWLAITIVCGSEATPLPSIAILTLCLPSPSRLVPSCRRRRSPPSS